MHRLIDRCVRRDRIRVCERRIGDNRRAVVAIANNLGTTRFRYELVGAAPTPGNRYAGHRPTDT
ncbi:MAG: hypothetical protein DLM57_17885 [Pseudonocardiales bacterium]|nr:MAG: hypothetical protein DLM57_17885 [Pseudonocardiales bacterium]